MPDIFAPLTILVMMGMVTARVMMLKRRGIETLHFGKLDKTDFLIPPFALFYFYMVFAAAFELPAVSRQRFFDSGAIAWVGVAVCLAGLGLLGWSLVSFGRSFRIGIDTEQPDRLVTSGAFAASRNPIYTAFGLILIGQFLLFSNWILLVYLGTPHLAVPPPGAAGGGLSQGALRRGIWGVLQAGEKVFVSARPNPIPSPSP